MSAVPAAVIALVDGRDRHVDRSTGRTLGAGRNLHHRLLRSRGGLHTAANLITLSGSGTTGTHGYMHAHPKIATHYGFIVPTRADPAEWPILLTNGLGHRRWALLTDDGLEVSITDAEAEERRWAAGLPHDGTTERHTTHAPHPFDQA